MTLVGGLMGHSSVTVVERSLNGGPRSLNRMDALTVIRAEPRNKETCKKMSDMVTTSRYMILSVCITYLYQHHHIMATVIVVAQA